MEEKELVDGIICPECEEAIWSRSGHDWRQCSCTACFIDGGRRYTRVGGPLDKIVSCRIDPSTNEVVEILGLLMEQEPEEDDYDESRLDP